MKDYSDIEFLSRVHKNAPIDPHANILFGNLQVVDIPFSQLDSHYMLATGTVISGWKAFRRIQRAHVLSSSTTTSVRRFSHGGSSSWKNFFEHKNLSYALLNTV